MHIGHDNQLKTSVNHNHRTLPCQIGAGLSYLHGKGLVHRSVTARNCLISSAGRLMLAGHGKTVVQMPSFY